MVKFSVVIRHTIACNIIMFQFHVQIHLIYYPIFQLRPNLHEYLSQYVPTSPATCFCVSRIVQAESGAPIIVQRRLRERTPSSVAQFPGQVFALSKFQVHRLSHDSPCFCVPLLSGCRFDLISQLFSGCRRFTLKDLASHLNFSCPDSFMILEELLR